MMPNHSSDRGAPFGSRTEALWKYPVVVIMTVGIVLASVMPSAHATTAAGSQQVSITYEIGSAGTTHTDVGRFASHVADTLADPDGWSLGGSIDFTRIGSGARFRILITAPAVLGGITGCSSTWSCRVGRNVYINENRWNRSTATWTLGLDAYRHYVVNHEVGHFLGLGHAGCPGAGRAAPVMMQQSKGAAPCHFNVWPLASERRAVAQRYGVPIREASDASLRYVVMTYLRTLQRWPSATVARERAIQLDGHELTRTGLLSYLFGSHEFATVPARATRLYESAFARPPDVSGLYYWGGRLQSGYPARSMASYLVGFSEFTSRHGHLDDAGFVEVLYEQVLGRKPDPQGQRYWVDRLRTGTMTRADLLLGFSESSEHRRRTRSRVPVIVAYIAVLDRTPDRAGLDYWSSRIDSGTPISEVLSYLRSRDRAVL